MSSKLVDIDSQIESLKNQISLLKKKRNRLETRILLRKLKKDPIFKKYSEIFDHIKTISRWSKCVGEDGNYYDYHLDIYFLNGLYIKLLYAERDGDHWGHIYFRGDKYLKSYSIPLDIDDDGDPNKYTNKIWDYHDKCVEYYTDGDNGDSKDYACELICELIDKLGFTKEYGLALVLLMEKIINEDEEDYDWDHFPLPNASDFGIKGIKSSIFDSEESDSN